MTEKKPYKRGARIYPAHNPKDDYVLWWDGDEWTQLRSSHLVVGDIWRLCPLPPSARLMERADEVQTANSEEDDDD